MLVARIYLFCAGTRDSRVASYWIDTLVLKTEGNTYATLLHHPFLFGENQRSAQEVARRISGAVAGEVCAKSSQDLTPNNRPFLAPLPSLHESRHTKYPSQTLIPRITLFAICLSFSSPPLHPCRFIRPLFSVRPLFRLLLVCSCVGLLACHDGSR